MKKDKKDHWIEYREKWQKIEAKAREKAKAAKKAAGLDHYLISLKDEKYFIHYPWGQELPAGSAEVYFYELLRDVQKFMSKEEIASFILETAIPDGSSFESIISSYVLWVEKKAIDCYDAREQKRTNDIEEVRASIGYSDKDKEGEV